MKPMRGLGWLEPQWLGCGVLLGFLMAPFLFLVSIGPNLHPSSILNLHISLQRADQPVLLIDGRNSSQPSVNLQTSLERADKSALSIDVGNNSQPSVNLQISLEHADEPAPLIDGGNNSQPSGKMVEENKLMCDVSEYRTDVCEMSGDIRVNGTSSSIILVTTSLPGTSTINESMGNNSWKIRPYARKWEGPTMSRIKELYLRSSISPEETPNCSIYHNVTAIVFSTGGFQGNYFHQFTDLLVPLFLTSHQYNGEVQFLITDFKPSWVDKYQVVLRQLSRYKVINLDANDRVHCFRNVVVGLRSHKELGIDPLKTPKGYSMTGFRQFLRTCYSLKREYAKSTIDHESKKPRLLIMSRQRSRSIKNERGLVRMARRLGYKVIVAGPEATTNLSRFANIVNSCDVIMGVHGAGLTNMVFLPTNATVIQVVPWGEITYGCRYLFGEPALGMGLRYLEYEIGQEESSLIERYPRHHAVFRDPRSIHKQGFDAIWDIFLNQQNVTLNLGRFRAVLVEALQSFR